jgi:hypothetical protein
MLMDGRAISADDQTLSSQVGRVGQPIQQLV